MDAEANDHTVLLISVPNWATTQADINQAAEALLRCHHALLRSAFVTKSTTQASDTTREDKNDYVAELGFDGMLI